MLEKYKQQHPGRDDFNVNELAQYLTSEQFELYQSTPSPMFLAAAVKVIQDKLEAFDDAVSIHLTAESVLCIEGLGQTVGIVLTEENKFYLQDAIVGFARKVMTLQ